MNLLMMVLNSCRKNVGKTVGQQRIESKSRSKRAFLSGALTVVATGVLASAGVPTASAQTAPPYVVYSSTPLAGTGSQNPKITFGSTRGHVAANSRGDFFANDGNGHVYEFPANGGAAILVWTDTNNNGGAGVAVDPADNLFIGNMNYSGGQGTNDQDSLLYEFPSTNGQYQGLPYIYNQNQPPGSCNPFVAATGTTPAIPANTTVCAVGFYQGAAYYYWQGWWDTAVDGAGNVYTYSGYDNHFFGTSNGVFQCQIFCAEQAVGNGATPYTTTVPNSLLSIATNYAGDLYLADGSTVSIVPAGSPSSSNAPAVFDSGYNKPYGVSFDPSGNLYVADATGVYEVPALEAGGTPCKGGTDKCTISAASKYLLLPVPPASTPATYGSYSSPGIDNRGNIIFSPSQGNLIKYSLWNGNFASAQIGATGSAPVSFTVSFNKATTLASLTAVQGSAPATEFTVVPGTCTVGAAFAAASTCTFTATFTPSGLGVRTGAVIITDSTGKTTYSYLSGLGTGTGVTVDPGTPKQLASGFKNPAGLAVDSAGNLYVADSTANTVKEYPASGAAAISIGAGLTVPTGVAVDAGGNVYIVNQGTGASGGSVVEVPSVAGVLTTSAQKTLVSGLNLPTDVIVDNDANLYVSVTGANQVLQLASASRDNASGALVSRGFGLSGPTGLAMDPNGNLYVADTGNNRVLQLADGSQNVVGSGLSAPTGVATDPSGSVIIADGTGRIIRVPNETFAPVGGNALGLNPFDQQVLESPLSNPHAIRSDNSGNLYVSDTVALVVDQLQRTTGSYDFGPWNLNTVSDSQILLLSNIGTADVTVGNPPFAAVPASSEFAVTTGSGSTACGGGLFHSGYQCTVMATFTPTAAGKVTYPLVFNAPTQTSATPTVNLIGTGVSEGAATLKLTQTAPTTATISYGQVVTFTATVTPTGSTTIPTGYIVFEFNGQDQQPKKLTATGSASITFTGLNAGSNTLSAYYTGDANYASLDSATIPVNILKASSQALFTVVGDSAVPLSVQPADSLTFTVVLTPSVAGLFTGTVNFVDLTHNVTINATPIALGQPDKNGITYTVSISPTAVSLLGAPQPGSTTFANYNVVAVYSGNSNYLPNTSQVIPLTISPKTYTITQDVTSVTASKSSPGIVNLTVTDYAAFLGAVSLQCSGLPANTYCVFRPGSAQLIAAVSPVLQNTQLSPLTIYPVPVQLQIMVDANPIPIEGSIFWIGALMLGLGLVWRRKVSNGKFGLMPLVAVLCIAGLTSLSGCGSGTSNAFPTPTGSYAVTITGTATPDNVGGTIPPCSAPTAAGVCTAPPTGTSINVVKTVNLSLTVK